MGVERVNRQKGGECQCDLVSRCKQRQVLFGASGKVGQFRQWTSVSVSHWIVGGVFKRRAASEPEQTASHPERSPPTNSQKDLSGVRPYRSPRTASPDPRSRLASPRASSTGGAQQKTVPSFGSYLRRRRAEGEERKEKQIADTPVG